MKSYLYASDRCSLFKNIATEIWHKIIDAHDVGIDVPEIGITADIITNILQYNKYHRANFEIYARKSWKEQLYGSDIDLFVETNTGQYVWFALQAKVLTTDKNYKTFKDGYNTSNPPQYQWEKLTLMEGLTGCKSYYLLYNGVANYNYEGTDRCDNPFREEQYGCSIVEPEEVRKAVMGSRNRPTFTSFHPYLAEPWRVLVCCYHDLSKFTLYSYSEIVESNPILKKIEYDKTKNNDELDEKIDDNENIPSIKGNRINKGCIDAKWNFF